MGQVSAMSPPGLGQVTVAPSASKTAQGPNPKEKLLAQRLEALAAAAAASSTSSRASNVYTKPGLTFEEACTEALTATKLRRQELA